MKFINYQIMKMKKGIKLLSILILTVFFNSCGGGNSTKQTKNEPVPELTSQKDWGYSKDIDTVTGDTIYTATLIAEGPFLSGYLRSTPYSIFSIEKCDHKIKIIVRLSIGNFIDGGQIGFYFNNTKPELECTYTLQDSQTAIINVSDYKKLVKKINMNTFFTLELPIQKQNNKVSFTYIYKEMSLDF